jgi:hypothetical protein
VRVDKHSSKLGGEREAFAIVVSVKIKRQDHRGVGQRQHRESLRDIEACLSEQSAKLNYTGLRGPIRRSFWMVPGWAVGTP